jgi:hypothetical protein
MDGEMNGDTGALPVALHTELTRDPRGDLMPAVEDGSRKRSALRQDSQMKRNAGMDGGRPWPPRRPGVLAATVAGAGLLAVACGGSSGPGGSAGAPGPVIYQQMAAYSQCVQSHGAPDFPDPTTQGNGVGIRLGPGDDPNSPQFQAAQKVCQAAAGMKGPGL